MTKACATGPAKTDRRDDESIVAVRSFAEILSLAAAPTFALMALLTTVLGGGPMDALCAAAHGSPLSGMVPMYLLMSAFHLAPWLKLAARRPRRRLHSTAA